MPFGSELELSELSERVPQTHMGGPSSTALPSVVTVAMPQTRASTSGSMSSGVEREFTLSAERSWRRELSGSLVGEIRKLSDPPSVLPSRRGTRPPDPHAGVGVGHLDLELIVLPGLHVREDLALPALRLHRVDTIGWLQELVSKRLLHLSSPVRFPVL